LVRGIKNTIQEKQDKLLTPKQFAGFVSGSVAWQDYIFYWGGDKPTNISDNITALNSSDKGQLDILFARCSEKDKELGEVSLDDPVILGYFKNDRLFGVGSLLYQGDSIADIGIIVDPAARNRGIGKALTYALINRVIEKNKIPQYTTMERNVGSLKVAEELGFDLYFIENGIKLDS
jgi:ribosomal protein S18 acetylase RimI-like enzyme